MYCLEESGQRFKNVEQTHLVLASGKLVQQNAYLSITMQPSLSRWPRWPKKHANSTLTFTLSSYIMQGWNSHHSTFRILFHKGRLFGEKKNCKAMFLHNSIWWPEDHFWRQKQNFSFHFLLSQKNCFCGKTEGIKRESPPRNRQWWQKLYRLGARIKIFKDP